MFSNDRFDDLILQVRLLLRFERISVVLYALKTFPYTMINLRHYCRS